MADQTTLPSAHVRDDKAGMELNFLPPAELDESMWRSLADNLRGLFHPEKLPPLQLTSKPVAADSLMLPDTGLWASLRQNVRDVVSPEKLPPLQLTSKPVANNEFLPPSDAERSLLSSLRDNLKSTFFPEKLPPLQVTSKPVKVRSIWGAYDYKQEGAGVSLVVHVLMIAGLIGISILTSRAVKLNNQPQNVISLADDEVPPDLPMTAKKGSAMGGGGGGGDRDKLAATKGKLPKLSMEQLAPPAVVIRNDNPRLPVVPTVVVPPDIKLASNLPNLGDPLSKIPMGPESNGTGSGGGIGSGSGGGVGSGSGPGVGPGHGGGYGGGAFRVGNGVSAPRALETPDPEYSEEARKAKYQGTVVLWLIVGPDGKPRDIRVSRPLGMGLDQKAIEAVNKWRFEPAMKDGRPVAVQINVEVNFRLY
ncbi:MAG TPA: energy transducer TonB [Candidatus Eisenbacteria bacterium]|nr:energy transducer TonB [Candidatus Eisenbacteria bacterium]